MAHIFFSPVNSLPLLWVPIPVFGYRAAGRMDIFAALLRGQYSAAAVRIRRCPLENGHIPVPIWTQPMRRTMSPVQLGTVGIAFYILTKFQNNKQKNKGKKTR